MLGVKPVRLFLAVLFLQVSKTDQTLNKSCEQITKNEKKMQTKHGNEAYVHINLNLDNSPKKGNLKISFYFGILHFTSFPMIHTIYSSVR